MTAPGQMGPVLYNPALLSREELIASFVVRHAELEELMDRVRSAPPDHSPQHVLILGWRGMGKTTLLHRVAYAVEEDGELRSSWVPVLFDEEQLNIGELADFWLNALEMLSIAVGERSIEEQADRLSASLKGRELEEAAYEALAEHSRRLNRRLLLLVDNVDLVLSRIGADREASRLREILQHESWLMLIGTSSQAIEATYDYGQPFYEMFRVLELPPLNERQTLEMLSRLAGLYNAADVARVIRDDPTKLKKLQLLMGGNPRTVGLLFGVLQEGPANEFRTQVERLLDSSTSLYKERLESLPVQSQRIFVALAQHWEPVTAAQVSHDLRMSRGVVSGQLHRLVEKGLVEKIRLPKRALGFQVKERFFNIWCLMRGGRKSRQRLRWLVEAVDLFYDAERLLVESRRIIDELGRTLDRTTRERLVEFGVALWRALPSHRDQAELVRAVLTSAAALDSISVGDLLDGHELSTLLGQKISEDEAVRLLTNAIEAGVSDTAFLDPAFRLLRSMRLHDKVIDLAQILIRRAPGSPSALREIATSRFFSGDFEEAKAAAGALVRIAPDDPHSWELLGNSQLFNKEPDEARRTVAEGLSLAPNDSRLIMSSYSLGVSEIEVPVTKLIVREDAPLPIAMLSICVVFIPRAESSEAAEGAYAIAHLILTKWPVGEFSYLLLMAIAVAGYSHAVVRALDEIGESRLKVLRSFLASDALEHILGLPRLGFGNFVDRLREANEEYGEYLLKSPA